MLKLQLISIFFSLISSCRGEHSLPKDRRACKPTEITFIPNNPQYYDESIELSFDSGLSLNNLPISRILEEECGLRDKISVHHRRGKRSHSTQGSFNLQKYFMEFYLESEKNLESDLLKDIKDLFDHLNHINTPMEQSESSEKDKFFYQFWRNFEEVRSQSNDDHFDLILEHTLRASLQLLIRNEKLSDIILNNPLILDRIKRRIPITNEKLLSEVKVSNVQCQQLNRDSLVVIFLKLRIPVIEKKTVEKCDDIGRISDYIYEYFELPSITFSENGHNFKVDIERCILDDFVFCPTGTIRPTICSKENLKNCQKIEWNGSNVMRELHVGFAVYGDYTQLITKNGDKTSRLFITPHFLYHIIPQSEEVISIGSHKLKQKTLSKFTTINQM